MNEMLKKLTSRKFLSAAAGILTGIGMIFGLDGNVIIQVAGAVVSGASVVAYIRAEGRIDAEAVRQAAQEIREAGQAVADSPAGDTPLLK